MFLEALRQIVNPSKDRHPATGGNRGGRRRTTSNANWDRGFQRYHSPTKTPLEMRKRRQRRRNKVARASRKANR